MSLASVTAKITGQALHLGRADTGGYYCGRRETEKTLHTWQPEEATCKPCIARYREVKGLDLSHGSTEAKQRRGSYEC